MDLTSSRNIYSLFAQAPAPLACHLRDKQFAALIEERTRAFVGRQFIFERIDEIIENLDFPSGYVLIKGEPGVGKTALIARLVKERGYIHHFNARSQGIASVSAFLKNICAQLIVLYQLNYSELPPESDRDGGFLSTLLFEAAACSHDRPVVILIDALDEADDAAFLTLGNETNKLLLPAALPNRVFFVITAREQTNYRLTVDRQEPIYLSDDDPQNQADVKSYIENYFLENPVQMNVAVAGWSLSREDFVKIIVEKSHGNFMYLVYILRDVRDAKLNAANIDDLRNLPAGLKNYYRQHWARMRKSDERLFEDIYKPVVCTLAAAKEPISLIKLCEITNLPLADAKRVVKEWREFLNEAETDRREERLYRLYHASFRDFLDEEVNLTSYHRLIAKQAEEKII